MEREKIGSRLGFILLSAGCAIGIGNVWKFPYMVGSYGGGIFVLCYLFFLVALGLPVLIMEFSVGRAGKKSPVLFFNELEKPGQKWHWHGKVCIAGNYLLMMYYITVAGWMLYYFYSSVFGKYAGMDNAQIGAFFMNMLDNPAIMCGCMIFVVVFAFLVLSFGLQKGLERITKIMMVFLLFLIVILAVHSILIKGGKEGLVFYLKPDLNKMKSIGIGTVISGAMSQAFFTLGLGIGSMAIFGSYIGKEHSLPGESINIAVLDTFVAICSGFIIFPACSAYGIAVDNGPSLLFITLPNVFNHLSGGRFWGSLFFLFMIFASFTTVLAVCENIVSMFMDLFNMSRKKACFINIPLMIVLSLPCALGYNLLKNLHPLGAGSQILDLEDFILSNIILPLGSLVFLFFCVLPKGWGFEKFMAEANSGEGAKIRRWMRPYFTFVLPVIILILFILGIIR